ncbi:MAG: hypothetical protein II359_05775 [Clostridia bacterium]|nr:hypothetical protein [Clostridia bacterium]
MDAETVTPVFIRWMHSITDEIADMEKVCFVGIHDRGDQLAKHMAEYLLAKEHISISVYSLKSCAKAEKTTAILVTDLLCTGKTCCHAVNKMLATGAFSHIYLATMTDAYNRRNVPIKADFVGERRFIPEDEKL